MNLLTTLLSVAQAALLAAILLSLKTLLTKMNKTLDEVLAAVEAGTTVDASLVALVAGLKQQLTDALSGTTLPAGVQEKVDAIFAAVTAQNEKVADAVLANTPEA